jgi:hypothetical protein
LSTSDLPLGETRPQSVEALAIWLDDLFVAEGHRFLSEVPWASHLTDEASPLDEGYYTRHRIETVWRIWLTAKTDAIALAHMIEEDYDAARDWARYACEELDHDRLFLGDLVHHGLSVDQVRSIGPFPATLEMVRYIERNATPLGSLPALIYSLYVEWNSERFSRRAVAKASDRFSAVHVTGSFEHVGIDTEESHYWMLVTILFRLLGKQHSLDIVKQVVGEIAAYLRRYFVELYEETQLRPCSSKFAENTVRHQAS